MLNPIPGSSGIYKVDVGPPYVKTVARHSFEIVSQTRQQSQNSMELATRYKEGGFHSLILGTRNLTESHSALEVGSFRKTQSSNAFEILSRGSIIGPNSISLEGKASYSSLNSFKIGSVQGIKSKHGFEISSGESFLIVADLIDSAIGSGQGGYYPSEDINAELLVNGVLIDIIAFTYQEPSGRIGSILNVTLARKDVSQVPIGASITFRLVVRTPSGSVTYTLMENGKLSGRTYGISYRKSGTGNGGPDDEVTFGALDVQSDKFSLAPEKSIILYNPNKVNPTSLEESPRETIIDLETGKPMMPVLETRTGLTARFAMRRAYVEGLGFANIVTNIEDYPVSRADFKMESGWHSGVQSLIGMYGPIYYVLNNILYVVDAEVALPALAQPKIITIDDYRRLSLTAPFKADANAVLLTYQISATDDLNGLTQRTVVKYDTQESGADWGSLGHTETETRITTVEKYYPDDPDNVISSLVTDYRVETRTDFGAGMVTTSIEHQQDFYHEDYKTGHDKRVDTLFLVGPNKSNQLIEALRIKCEIGWKDDPINKGVKIQTRNFTRTEGLIYDTTETITRINPITGASEEVTISYPAVVAQQSGVINDDGNMRFGLIETKSETLRHITGNQYDVHVTVTDGITGAIKHSSTTPTTGSPTTDPYETRSKTVLIKDQLSIDDIGFRIPVGVNAGELPRDRAIALGYRALNRFKNPLFETLLELPGVDFGVFKGSVVKGQLRAGYTNNHLVTGRGITGSNLGRRGHRINMSLDGTELP